MADLYQQVQTLQKAVNEMQAQIGAAKDQNKNKQFDRDFTSQEIINRVVRFQQPIYDKNGNEILG